MNVKMKKLLLISLIFILLGKSSRSTNLFPNKPHIKAVEQMNQKALLQAWHIDSIMLLTFINKGFFRPNDTCKDFQIVFPSMKIWQSQTDNELQAIFGLHTNEKTARALSDYFYKNIPELFIDTTYNFDFVYEITNENIVPLIDMGKEGKIAAICTNYTDFIEQAWHKYRPNGQDIVLSVNIDSFSNYPLSHKVNLIYFKDENTYKALVLDANFGYLYPLKEDGELFSIEELESVNLDSFSHTFSLRFSKEDVLKNKRFLTNHIWPCTYMKSEEAQYFYTQKGALRKYEIHDKESLELLNIEYYTPIIFQKTILNALVKNTPQFM